MTEYQKCFCLAIITFMLVICLFGCGASVHTDNRATVQVPRAEVTHTVTTKEFVPVYKPVITSKTETNGTAPLHDVTIKPIQTQ